MPLMRLLRLAFTFVFLNLGEILLTAWLVQRWFTGLFKLEDVPHVLGFQLQAENLRAVSDELTTILNTAGIGITRCSRDLRYLRANETYATIVGLPLVEIIGRSIVEVMGEAAFAAIRLHRTRACG
jgi:PAS domain-containing protein